jgi:hypothetical protein
LRAASSGDNGIVRTADLAAGVVPRKIRASIFVWPHEAMRRFTAGLQSRQMRDFTPQRWVRPL